MLHAYQLSPHLHVTDLLIERWINQSNVRFIHFTKAMHRARSARAEKLLSFFPDIYTILSRKLIDFRLHFNLQ